MDFMMDLIEFMMISEFPRPLRRGMFFVRLPPLAIFIPQRPQKGSVWCGNVAFTQSLEHHKGGELWMRISNLELAMIIIAVDGMIRSTLFHRLAAWLRAEIYGENTAREKPSVISVKITPTTAVRACLNYVHCSLERMRFREASP